MDLPSRATSPVVAGPKLSARPGRRRSASGGGCASALRVAVFVVVLAPAEANGGFTTKEELQAAVDDLPAAEAAHGPIAGWDVSRVDDMSELFRDKATFNAQIGGWDTSRVTTMDGTFYDADVFNRPLDWDTSSVTTMQSTLRGAVTFNAPLVWDTSKVAMMSDTFGFAGSFNKPLAWDTSAATSMKEMFYGASLFDQPLAWDTSKVADMSYTFQEAEVFNSELAWDTSAVTIMWDTFYGASAFNQPLAWDASKMTDSKSFWGIFTETALASDECSKAAVYLAWQGVAAFTTAYGAGGAAGDWSGAVCTEPRPPPPPAIWRAAPGDLQMFGQIEELCRRPCSCV